MMYSQTWSISHLLKSSICIKEPVWNIPNLFNYYVSLHKSVTSISETSASKIIPNLLIDLYKTATIYMPKI